MTDCAFYTVTGRDYFPGAVALVNSLRLCGHHEPVYVLDSGMDARQRELLGGVARIVDPPDAAPPSLQKLVAPMAHPAEVRVILDADMIVCRGLGDALGEARRGRLVAFENESPRHFAEWGEALGLGPLRRGPYLMSSAVAVGRATADAVLAAVAEGVRTLDTSRTWLGDGEEDDPFFYADQDVLNAVVAARLEPEEVVALPGRLAAIPPFTGLRIADAESLRVVYPDRSEPYLLHHYFRKPWLARLRSNVYSRLLTRLLIGPDVAIRLEPDMLPLRLRSGARAALARTAVDIGIGIPAGVRRRLGGRPREIRAWSDEAHA